MSGDADTVREALEHMTYNGPVTRAAKAALARLEAHAAQRDALAEALREIDEWAGGHYEPNDWLRLRLRAALAEAATREETP